jgi:hypothetical protein
MKGYEMKITELLNYLQKTKRVKGELPVFILTGGKERLVTTFTLNLTGDKIWLMPEADLDFLDDIKKKDV